jgi:hypothetical protein
MLTVRWVISLFFVVQNAVMMLLVGIVFGCSGPRAGCLTCVTKFAAHRRRVRC